MYSKPEPRSVLHAPEVGQKMVTAGSDTILAKTSEGIVDGWRLSANGVATVTEVSDDGLLKLRSPDGVLSCWQRRNKFKFEGDPSRKEPKREPRSGGKRAQLKAAAEGAVTEASVSSPSLAEQAGDGELAPEKAERPTEADISQCISVLRQLQPRDLEDPALAELVEVAGKLFKRKFFKDKFGSDEAVGFLKKSMDIDKKIRRLQSLEQVVHGYRDTKKQAAENCGLNVVRKENLEKINAEMALMDSEEHDSKPVAAIADCVTQGDGVIGTVISESTEGATGVGDDKVEERPGPKGDYHHTCNGCSGSFKEMHHFYHQLCKGCAQLSWDKRYQTADMTGMVCVVTGGRVRIGHQIVLKLLRAGAFVLTTTRYPMDCAQRFSREEDFHAWRDRLEIVGPVELSNMRLVERFCDQLIARFPRIHVLINNAAQTITRSEGWHYRMGQLEDTAASCLSDEARALVKKFTSMGQPTIRDAAGDVGVEEAVAAPMPREGYESSSPANDSQELARKSATAGHIEASEPTWSEAINLTDFPKGKLDASGQPLDLTAKNSWDRRLCDVSTLELLQTLAANAAAPFIICSRLASVLEPPTKADPYGHIVNVQALEGQFYVKKKSRCHPHTNMAKAALNMLTYTSANDLFPRRILMNSADTGWVTDMASGGVGPMATAHSTFVATPLDEVDGAARVLDPVFSHLNDPTWLIRGKLFKDYYVVNW
eukprot:TRINITY_DN50253_c0_g1_i1.p1 TRINITY_DN50253_c0_g1~~TRINITY_DN50253_c0_g1_i1.p1  ORF type:complete len:713 (-),score=87.07 TRINITY_DN50253_c0_g1_i1:14-2152(-)